MNEQAKGHGHVTPNPNGDKARCGGPKICKVCMAELAALKAMPVGAALEAERVVNAQRLLDWNRAQPEPRPIVIGREYQVAEACAHLAAPAGVPEGWRPVPVEPTNAMTHIGQALRYDAVNSIGHIYRQMIAAAPSPAPASEQQSVAWQFYQDGKWHTGMDAPHKHREYTEAAGYPVRDLYAGPVINAPASDPVQVPLPLADRLLSRSDTTDYQLACAELRALLNGGH